LSIFAAVTFWRRLRLYGTGFLIGLAIVYAMFGTRSCVSPNEMKMQELVFQKFEWSAAAICKMKCIRRNEALVKIELRHFEVDYDASDVHKKPCGVYLVVPKKGFEAGHPYRLLIHDCDTVTRVTDLQLLSPDSCRCQ
jgi:hypothetical protein